jgi:hypothetical protein
MRQVRQSVDVVNGVDVIKVVGSASAEGAQVSADPWIPLMVYWGTAAAMGHLDLYIDGSDGGYVELRVDAVTGALTELVVLESPPHRGAEYLAGEVSTQTGVPTIDLAMWEWRVTPDYEEPARKDARVKQRLSRWESASVVALQFSDDPPDHLLSAGDVRIGVSSSGELVCLIAEKPGVVVPPDYPS